MEERCISPLSGPCPNKLDGTLRSMTHQSSICAFLTVAWLETIEHRDSTWYLIGGDGRFSELNISDDSIVTLGTPLAYQRRDSKDSSNIIYGRVF